MPETDATDMRLDRAAAFVIGALLVLTAVMLLALLTRTPPHPPLEVAPFALGPFLGASLALGVCACPFAYGGERAGIVLSLIFVATALVSFGPQKYFDPAFSRIWPTVVVAQAGILFLLGWSVLRWNRPRRRAPNRYG